MNKKFAYFTFAKSLDQIPFRFSWIAKMPKKMIWKHILRKNPIVLKDILLMESEGYEVQLPILEEELDEKPKEDLSIIIEQSIHELMNNDVDIVSMPTAWTDMDPQSIRVANGSEVTPFFMFRAIQKVLEITGQNLKYVDITIIDGKDKKTDFIIDYIYPNVNFLSVVTDDPHRFDDKVYEIYGDVGLNLQVIQKDRFRNSISDIIINLDPEPDVFFYYFKKGGVYFDLTSKPQNIKNILLKRQDLLVIDDFLLQYNAEYLSSTFCEMAWFVGNRDFRKYLLYEYEKGMLQSILHLPKEYGLSVAGLRQYGKTLNTIQLSQWVDKYLRE